MEPVSWNLAQMIGGRPMSATVVQMTWGPRTSATVAQMAQMVRGRPTSATVAQMEGAPTSANARYKVELESACFGYRVHDASCSTLWLLAFDKKMIIHITQNVY